MILVDLSLLNLFGFIGIFGLLNLKTPVEKKSKWQKYKIIRYNRVIRIKWFLGKWGGRSGGLWSIQLVESSKLNL